MIIINKKNNIYLIFAIIGLIALIYSFLSYNMFGIWNMHSNNMMQNNMMQNNMMQNNQYQTPSYNQDYKGDCCIKKPCSYCQTKKEGCDCMEDVINGEVPCRECVNGIIKGKGNYYLKDYFVDSLDSLYENKDELKSIIKTKYNI